MLKKQKDIEVAKAISDQKKESLARDICGLVPQTYQQYFQGFIDKHSIIITLDNDVVGSTYSTRKIINTSILRDTLYELRGKAYLNLVDLGTDADFNTSFGLFLNDKEHERRTWLIDRVLHKHIKENKEKLIKINKELKILVNELFKSGDDICQPFELVLQVIRFDIWQTKRKMLGLTVDYPLMPIIFGKDEGTGKSRLIQTMYEPIREAMVCSLDYEVLSDKSNMTIWGAYKGVVEELAGFGKAEQQKLNDIITRTAHPVRILYRNQSVMVKNCLSLWGTTNEAVNDIIRSSGFMRRFFQLYWKLEFGTGSVEEVAKLNAAFELINGTDWMAILQSVDEYGESPLKDYKEELRKAQLLLRNKTCIEEWCDAIKVYEIEDWKEPEGGRHLYEMFKRWAGEYGSNWARQYTETKFCTELKSTKGVNYNSHDRKYTLISHTGRSLSDMKKEQVAKKKSANGIGDSIINGTLPEFFD